MGTASLLAPAHWVVLPGWVVGWRGGSLHTSTPYTSGLSFLQPREAGSESCRSVLGAQVPLRQSPAPSLGCPGKWDSTFYLSTYSGVLGWSPTMLLY